MSVFSLLPAQGISKGKTQGTQVKTGPARDPVLIIPMKSILI
jgi:hypothetical protein